MSYSTKNTPKAKLDSFFAKADNYVEARRKAWNDKKGKKKDKNNEAVSD